MSGLKRMHSGGSPYGALLKPPTHVWNHPKSKNDIVSCTIFWGSYTPSPLLCPHPCAVKKLKKLTILDLAQTQIHGVGPWEHVARVGIRGHLARVACRAHYFWFRRLQIRPVALAQKLWASEVHWYSDGSPISWPITDIVTDHRYVYYLTW